MPFTFLVEDGTGLPDATSYAAVAEADDYYVIDTNYAAIWDDYTDEQKEFRLAWGSRIIDQKTRWNGYLAVAGSGLRWPRYLVYDVDSNPIPENVIPKQLKQAVFELIKYIDENDPTTSQNIEHIRRLQVDVLEIEYQEDTSQITLPPIVNEILRGLGFFTTGGSRFARILKV